MSAKDAISILYGQGIEAVQQLLNSSVTDQVEGRLQESVHAIRVAEHLLSTVKSTITDYANFYDQSALVVTPEKPEKEKPVDPSLTVIQLLKTGDLVFELVPCSYSSTEGGPWKKWSEKGIPVRTLNESVGLTPASDEIFTFIYGIQVNSLAFDAIIKGSHKKVLCWNVFIGFYIQDT